MSLLINKELIWVSIPRCASSSIEMAFVDSDLYFEHINYPNFKEMLVTNNVKDNLYHSHFKLSELKKVFGNKESFCIRRDWFERWISALKYFWDHAENKNLEPVIKYEDIDNEFIYRTFDKNFSNDLLSTNGFSECSSKLIKDIKKQPKHLQRTSHLFLSQYYWTDNINCDYEFDINNLDGAEKLIKEKFNYEIKFLQANISSNRKNKLIYNNELKNHIWDMFEKPFSKNKKILL